MAVSENSGKDNSGQEIYKINESNERLLDEHNHLIQKHDLDEIAFACRVSIRGYNSPDQFYDYGFRIVRNP